MQGIGSTLLFLQILNSYSSLKLRARSAINSLLRVIILKQFKFAASERVSPLGLLVILSNFNTNFYTHWNQQYLNTSGRKKTRSI